MKKVLFILIFFSLFILINPKEEIKAKEESNFEIISQTRLRSDYDQIYLLDDGIIGVKNNIVYYDDNYSIKLYEEKDSIKDIKAVKNNDYLYLLVLTNKYKLKLFDLDKNRLIKEEKLDYEYISSIDYYDSLYISGNYLNDGYISVYNDKLDNTFSYLYEGEKEECVMRIIKNDTNYYVLLKKAPFDYFYNLNYSIGNLDQNNPHLVLLKYDLDFNYISSHYFTESDYKVFEISETRIYLSLINKDKQNYYLLNHELDLIDKKLDIDNDYQLLVNKKNDLFLDINYLNSSIRLDNKVIEELHLPNLKKASVKNGLCNLILVGFNDISILKLRELEIIKNEIKYCNKDYLDYENSDNLFVGSFFSTVTKNLNNIEPYFSKTINGNYNRIFDLILEDGYVAKINSLLIIKKYTNFIDYGLYPLGYMLEFFGTASLNGKTIYNGTRLDEEGDYLIDIKDCNGKIESYHLFVRKEYQNSSKTVNMDYDYVVNLNEPFSLKLSIENSLNNQLDNPPKLFINGKIYENFSLNNNELYLNFPTTIRGYQTYHLDYLIYNDGLSEEKIIIDKLIVLCVNGPKINYSLERYLEKNNVSVKMGLNDIHRNFRYFLLKNNDKVSLITGNENLRLNNEFSLNAVFMDESGKTYFEEILHYDTNKTEELNIKMSYQSNYVESADISIDLPKDKNDIKVLDIKGKSILTYYNDEEDLSLFYIMLLVSTILIITGIVLIIIRKKKKKANHF